MGQNWSLKTNDGLRLISLGCKQNRKSTNSLQKHSTVLVAVLRPLVTSQPAAVQIKAYIGDILGVILDRTEPCRLLGILSTHGSVKTQRNPYNLILFLFSKPNPASDFVVFNPYNMGTYGELSSKKLWYPRYSLMEPERTAKVREARRSGEL